MMKTHHFKTTDITEAYIDRSCDLKFEPTGLAKDGIHVILVGIT